MPLTVPKGLKPILDFTIQVVVGSVAFLIVYCAAVTISVVVQTLPAVLPVWAVLPHWVVAMGEYAEMGLFGIDLFCFSLFVLAEALKLVRSLWRDWRG